MIKNANKVLFSLFSLFSAINAQTMPDLDASKYFDTSFLSNYDLVAQALIKEEGFEEVFFLTPDNINLHGLLLKRPEAKYNIIMCAGFYPGRKEGLASIYTMLPQDCNIFLFDARGHGKSDGSFMSTIYKYGTHEYKDMIGALRFVHRLNKQPIIIHGTCIGAFHTAHAIITLQKNNLLQYLNVKGLIFDSIPSSVIQMLSTPKNHLKEKVLPALFRSWYTHDSKEQLKQRYLFRITNTLVSGIVSGIELFTTPSLKYYNTHRHLHNKIHHIPCPILFIHSYDDNYTSIDHAKQLAQKTDSVCWWINKPSAHAAHALKHKYEYQKTMNNFIQQVVSS